jgi:protein-S-isoprenylcysteine O-methyltransferase Ste14
MRTVLKLTVIIVSGLFFALAILGEGGIAAFPSRPPLIALVLTFFILVGASFFVGGNISSGEREDRSNRWVLAAFAIIAILDGYLPAYSDRIEFWTIDGDTIRWLGVLLFATGGVLRIWPVYILGNRFSGLVAIQPGHELVTDGIYGLIRNPSYLGLLANSLGWALAFRSGIGVMLTALMMVPLHARIVAEEALLRSQFGEEYRSYYQQTWRLIPWIY